MKKWYQVDFYRGEFEELTEAEAKSCNFLYCYETEKEADEAIQCYIDDMDYEELHQDFEDQQEQDIIYRKPKVKKR